VKDYLQVIGSDAFSPLINIVSQLQELKICGQDVTPMLQPVKCNRVPVRDVLTLPRGCLQDGDALRRFSVEHDMLADEKTMMTP
jgi:hypothetical protein